VNHTRVIPGHTGVTFCFPKSHYCNYLGLLNSFIWPTDPLNLALHGSNEIVMCELLGVYSKSPL